MIPRETSLVHHAVPTDNELWEAVRQKGCATAFSKLYDRYWSTIYTTSFSYLKNAEQSEEITHDIFVNLWRRRHSLDIQSFPAYLRASARYRVYKNLKSEYSSPIQYIAAWDQVEAPSVGNGGEERIRQDEMQNHVSQILEGLPARCQEIFRLSRKDHLTNDEIAARLGISKRSVENQLTRALKQIRVHLRTIGICLSLLVKVFLN